MPMPNSVANATRVHLHVMKWMENNQNATYSDVMAEMERFAPGWFEQDGDPMIIDWIVGHLQLES